MDIDNYKVLTKFRSLIKDLSAFDLSSDIFDDLSQNHSVSAPKEFLQLLDDFNNYMLDFQVSNLGLGWSSFGQPLNFYPLGLLTLLGYKNNSNKNMFLYDFYSQDKGLATHSYNVFLAYPMGMSLPVIQRRTSTEARLSDDWNPRASSQIFKTEDIIKLIKQSHDKTVFNTFVGGGVPLAFANKVLIKDNPYSGWTEYNRKLIPFKFKIELVEK